MKDRFNRAEVRDRYGISDSTLWRWITMGRFPEPIRANAQSMYWRLEDLEEWEAAHRRRHHTDDHRAQAEA